MLNDTAALNVTLNNLRYLLDVEAPTLMNQSNLSLQNATMIQELSKQLIGQINLTLLQSYDTFNGR